MPPHKNESHWKDENVKKLAGAATFTDLCIHAETWTDSELEDLIDPDLAASTGKYRKMRNGTRPDDYTIGYIEDALRGKPVKIKEWRDHAYWPLLCSNHSGSKYIFNALRSIGDDLKQYIWSEWDPGEDYQCTRKSFDLDNIKRVAENKNFDALVILTAWAREAREQNIYEYNLRCAQYSKNVFADVVCSTPQLFIRWPLLLLQYANVIWRPPETEISEFWFKPNLPTLVNNILNIENEARAKGILLPPKHLVRQLNKNELNYLYSLPESH